ncbi:MAG: isovaleryl-CoA dehydrogenase [Dehalococcoidia bacterium]|nr:MAG: isovaleryl-CoA dehydrogenase [Dehalococcoidia bacterium]
MVRPSVDPATSSPAHQTLALLERLLERAREHVAARCQREGRLDEALLTTHQLAGHGLAQLALQVEAGRQLLAWADRLAAGPEDLERRIAEAWVARTALELRTGLTLSAVELVPAAELGLTPEVLAALDAPPLPAFLARAGGVAADDAIVAQIEATSTLGRRGLDEALSAVQAQFARFATERIAPLAPFIHRQNALVPPELIRELADLGVFGLTVPEEYGGSGLGKLAMVVVTEELTRGAIGVGSLGTRSEIAAELVLHGGLPEQKAYWLPRLARAEALPTAAFTEPNAGSDLAAVQTRAIPVEGGWRIYGRKTWMTHGARANLLTLLARTDPDQPGHRGLSLFLAPKTPGDETTPFPDPGISGSEIPVLGYRGLREYEVSFDGFFVPAAGLLGGRTGQGFRHLMATMESARIQTAARGVGVAQAAFEEAWRYAQARIQFGRPIGHFPRIRAKLARAAVLIQAARQLTYAAARRKESGQRCDLEAGMAKLAATRAAWEVADTALQIHGGLGYAEETPVSRLFLDARVLPIFEGTNEIQAQIIARRLLE